MSLRLRSVLLALVFLVFAPSIRAQDRPASASSSAMENMDGMDMEGMDMKGMEGMHHESVQAPPRAPHAAAAHPPAQAGGDAHATHPTHASTVRPTSHEMEFMRGDHAPADARDPDYSEGIDPIVTHGLGMAMADTGRFALWRFDQLEAFHGSRGSGQQWAFEGGYGNDRDKLWLRSEGERSGGRLEDGDAEILWSHAAAAFWNTELGLRADAGEGPERYWAAFGIQGLAPYWFELSLTGYAGPSGRTAMRLRSEYELLFTQRLVLQPEFEINAYGRADPARRLGSGVSDASLGLRLRYEFHRQFAPYAGVLWIRRFGDTATAQGRFERRWVAGIRWWF